MATGVDIEERWGFLEPWTRVLKRQFSNDLCRLQLSPFDPAQLYVNFTDQDEAQMTQEGIKLLAAVAFVDYNAWKYLLHSHCGVKIDVEGDIIVRFQLRIYSNKQTVTDLVQMCGIQQHYRPRREYSDALSSIAQKLHTKRRGKEILVPIEVFIVEKPQGLRRNLEEILRLRDAGETIRREWDERSLPVVGDGAFRCTFVLSATKAGLHVDDSHIDLDMAKKIGGLVHNEWFARVSLRLSFNDMDKRLKREVMGQLLMRV